MATLEQVQGGSLVPDFSQGINAALKIFGTGRERAKEDEEQRLASVVSGSKDALRPEERGADPLGGPTPEQQNEALLRLSALNPQAAQVIRGNLERNDRNALKQIALETEQSQKNAAFIKGAKDFRGMRQRIMTVADQKRAAGQSVEGPLRLLALPEEKLRLEMDSRITQLTDAKTLVSGIAAVEERERKQKLETAAQVASRLLKSPVEQQPTEIGNLIRLAENNGNTEAAAAFTELAGMDRGQRQAALRKMVDAAGPGKLTSVVPGQRQTDRFGNVISEGGLPAVGVKPIDVENFTQPSVKAFNEGGRTDPSLLVIDPEAIKRKNPGLFSASTKQFNNGTIIWAAPDGSRRVTNTRGEVVKGPKAQEVVDQANEFEIERQQKIAQATRLGASAAKEAEAAFESIKTGESDIRLYKQAIDQLKKGAKTGPISSQLPSFRLATIRLENIQKQLGLNVISGVTFGALSEKELQVAMQTALPTGLDENGLQQWLNDRIVATEKLNEYLSEAATFLSKEGNTQSDFRAQKRAEQEKRRKQGGGTGAAKGLSTNEILDKL